MPKDKETISLTVLARIVFDQYSDPPELLPVMFVEIVHIWSSHGTTTIEKVETVAHKYIANNPENEEIINMFLQDVRRLTQ